MKTTQLKWVAVLAVLGFTVSGCSLNDMSVSRYKDPITPATKLSDIVTSPHVVYPPPKDSENFFMTAFQKAKEGLTIKPKVIPAQDPLAISTDAASLDADLFIKAAKVLEARGDLAGAETQYTTALKLEPRHIPAHLALAGLYERQKRPDKAIPLYTTATQLDPMNALAKNRLQLCHTQQQAPAATPAVPLQAAETSAKPPIDFQTFTTVPIENGTHQTELSELLSMHPQAAADYHIAYLLNSSGDHIGYLFQRRKNQQAPANAFATAMHFVQPTHTNSKVLKRLPPLPREFDPEVVPPNLTRNEPAVEWIPSQSAETLTTSHEMLPPNNLRPTQFIPQTSTEHAVRRISDENETTRIPVAPSPHDLQHHRENPPLQEILPSSETNSTSPASGFGARLPYQNVMPIAAEMDVAPASELPRGFHDHLFANPLPPLNQFDATRTIQGQ